MAGGRKNRSTSIGLAQLATGLPLAAHYICTCIYQVGKKLRNCATMYSSRVGEGKYVLVALEHAKNATPVALGGYVVGSGQWEQAVPSAPLARPLTDARLRSPSFSAELYAPGTALTHPRPVYILPHNLPHPLCTGRRHVQPAARDDAASLRFREYRSTRSMPSARSSSAVMRRRGSLSCCSARSKKGRA